MSTFKRERQRIQYNFNSATPIITKFFAWDSHHEWAFVGGPMTSHKKSQMANCGHIEFLKC